MAVRIGIDSGGTFTDVVVVDQDRLLLTHKVPSTPSDPGLAVLSGIMEAIRQLNLLPGDISHVIHGTTVATNALLERKGARTALVTTRGFRDVLAIQRQNRPELYNLRARKPEPLVPRELRFELSERTLADGTLAESIDAEEVDAIAEQLEAAAVESIVVGFLHSHTNPQNEVLALKALSKRLPNSRVSTSHTISSEPGEYERFSTAVANGYVQPIMQRYLSKLASKLHENGITAKLSVMKSSGGIATAEQASERAIDTVLSGPAGGVQACVQLAQQSGRSRLIAADMGGTSFDVALVTDAQPSAARESMMGGLPLRASLLDIHTIGAGGGSIGWVDAGGALRVGPQSAGARPGPVCYGHGGTEPTVTDANLVLGRLSEAAPLAGSLSLSKEQACEAIRKNIAEPLRMTVEAAALGMLQIVNAAMVAAIRKLTLEQGIDPRSYAICPYGGAGPLHAAELADELGIEEILLPSQPGVFSAAGLLQSPLQQERERHLVRSFETLAPTQLRDLITPLASEATEALLKISPEETVEVMSSVRLRYVGQNQDITMEIGDDFVAAILNLHERFHEEHHRRYGFSRPDQPLELAGLAVKAKGSVPPNPLFAGEAREQVPANDNNAYRTVVFAGGVQRCSVISRSGLEQATSLPGPLVLQQDDTTVLVPPKWQIEHVGNGILRMHRKEPRS